MGIRDRKIMFCRGISETSVDKKIPTIYFNNRTVYYCFNNPFTSDFGSPDLHLPPITIDDIPRPYKRARYTPYLLPATISVASENYVSTLADPSDSPLLILITSNYPNPSHAMKKGGPYFVRVKIGYCYSKHNEKYSTN